MIDSLIKFGENDLSKSIIIPLLEKIYNCRVDFTGGAPEKGRDIIVYREDAFGHNDFLGIQVKKTQATPNSTIKSFEQLLNQISQMKSEGVIDPATSERVKFRQLAFITPYPINDRTYDSHSGALRKVIDEGVTIIDGKQLKKLIEKHAPELIPKIKGGQSCLIDKTLPKLTNKSLMGALGFQKNRELCDIFCDAGFVAGNSKFNVFSNRYSPNLNCNEIKTNNIHLISLIKDCETLFEVLEVHYIPEELLRKAKEKYDNCAKLDKQKRDLARKAEELVRELKDIINVSKFNSYYPEPIVGKDADAFFKDGFTKTNEGNVDFIVEVVELKKIHDEKLNILSELKVATNNYNDSQYHRLPVNPENICIKLNNKIETLQSSLDTADKELKLFLVRTKEIQNIIAIIDRHREQFFCKKTRAEASNSILNITIKNVFDTNLNTIVLGEAGSGKTTNLQIYTRNLYKNNEDKLIIYMTLNELSKLSFSEGKKCILSGIIKYLNGLGITTYSSAKLKDQFRTQKTTLILDSIDEAIVSYGWIIEEISIFAERYKNCQIITSSRYTVHDLSSIDFVSVSLLPFNHAQKREFYNKWFIDAPTKAKDLIEHLIKYPKLDSVVTNPLSATIMATLQESNMPLPKTESSLYKKRFELLSGLFDKFKGVSRAGEQPENILKCARYLAYEMHKRGVRSLPKAEMISIILEEFGKEYDAKNIIKELIIPAEILLVEINGEYSYGHLRFQEFLASEQLVDMRSENLSAILVKEWWNDVFLLYSQHAYRIEWLIDDVVDKLYMTEVSPLIYSMIEFRPEHEWANLKRKVQSAIWIENENKDLSDEYSEFDYSDDHYVS